MKIEHILCAIVIPVHGTQLSMQMQVLMKFASHKRSRCIEWSVQQAPVGCPYSQFDTISPKWFQNSTCTYGYSLHIHNYIGVKTYPAKHDAIYLSFSHTFPINVAVTKILYVMAHSNSMSLPLQKHDAKFLNVQILRYSFPR